MPTTLRRHARWLELAGVPAMVVRPDGDGPCPLVLWMHGRTVHKELDPGRYLRWLRAGIGACAVDLPGHGQRFDEALQAPDRTLDVVTAMVGEIDPLVEAVGALGGFDLDRLGIGGFSAGGMSALVRLCRRHRFRCASVEATSGSWSRQRHRAMFEGRRKEAEALEPIRHLKGWREIPLLALHARHDEWVPVAGEVEFIEALRERYRRPDLVELVLYDRTGAPFEHAGFGRMSSDAKNRQVTFLKHTLLEPRP
jgi:dienelactone hydrolase